MLYRIDKDSLFQNEKLCHLKKGALLMNFTLLDVENMITEQRQFFFPRYKKCEI